MPSLLPKDPATKCPARKLAGLLGSGRSVQLSVGEVGLAWRTTLLLRGVSVCLNLCSSRFLICSVLFCSALLCSAMLCFALLRLLYSMVFCSVMWCFLLRRGAPFCCMVLVSLLFCFILFCYSFSNILQCGTKTG